MTTHAAPHACKAAIEHATVDEAIELALHHPRHLVPKASDGGNEGRAVVADGPMQRGVFDLAGPIARRQRRAGLSPAPVPVVATREGRKRAEVHPDTAVAAGRSVQVGRGDRPCLRRQWQPHETRVERVGPPLACPTIAVRRRW
jgi:hypothetical protein